MHIVVQSTNHYARRNGLMTAHVTEIADGIFRLSVLVPEIAPPQGFTFNSFLIDDDEPLLFHAGQRAMFPLFAAAVASIMPVERLRWISFGHIEADECGAMNLWLAAAPRAVADGELITSGRRRVRYIDTPHVPHAWESGIVYEETSGILFCGDLFTQFGAVATTQEDIVPGAIVAEDLFHATSIGPATAPTLRRLAKLNPSGLALMH